jgi:hypothetical protein
MAFFQIFLCSAKAHAARLATNPGSLERDLEHDAEKRNRLSDYIIHQLIDLECVLIDWTIPSNRNAL